MRHGLTITPLALVAALAASAFLATPALADSGAVEGSSASAVKPAPATTTATVEPTKDPVTTTTAKPAPTISTPKPEPTTASTPVTTAAPVTTSSSPTCTDSSSSSACAPTTTPTSTPVTPTEETPTTPAARVPADAPAAPGGGDLPFTGPGDVVLAIVLALLAGSGGILFMAGAAGREQIEGLNPRGMDSPSGFKLAYRELLKHQVD